MRGALCGSDSYVLGAGIIPAYAGSTSARLRRSHRRWDHPRVCGEHDTATSRGGDSRGSSPRMRGAHVGIIHAIDLSRDHPRVCGEHGVGTAVGVFGEGSSPRMRGALAGVDALGIAPGIIPAYAGSTPHASLTPFSAQDHPRVCGEHKRLESKWQQVLGSSPRMRGAP